jgi:hypothetical protein
VFYVSQRREHTSWVRNKIIDDISFHLFIFSSFHHFIIPFSEKGIVTFGKGIPSNL